VTSRPVLSAAVPASDIMLRRAFLSLVPALLALTFLCGTAGTSVGGPEASATSANTGAATTPAVRGTLTQDVPDGVASPCADEDDNPDDRIVRIATTIVWPERALKSWIFCASDGVSLTHRPCAAPARAPPTA
jgi:hypothetical protein